MFTILFRSLKNFCNLLNCVLLFILNYVTPSHTPHLTLQTYRTTMTQYLQFLTKTLVGLLCLPHGSPPSTNDISPTFLPTDVSTTLTVNKPSLIPTHYLANSKKDSQLLSQTMTTRDCWTPPHKTNYNYPTWNYYLKYTNSTNLHHTTTWTN